MILLKNIKRVAVAVSGGVDSSVAALILKRSGYDVIGVFMKNWDVADETGHCSSSTDASDAAYVCKKLDIPFTQVDFVKPYWNEVFQSLIEDYENGFTPNPDVLCNKFIKFKRFLHFAEKQLGCDMIATGHYARRSFHDDNSLVSLLTAQDSSKDQTFFLSQISQRALQKTLFPLGDMYKANVKRIASANGLLKIAERKESMGMCFIGTRHFQTFIDEYIEEKIGDFIDIATGKRLGTHFGKHRYTIGQRCRLGGYLDRLYIARKTESEDILVAMGHDHPVFYGKYVFPAPPHWIRSPPKEIIRNSFMRCHFRFQHRDPLIGCSVFQKSDGHLVIILDEPLRALTPGQFAVLYKDGECLGSSRILHAGPTEFTLNLKVTSDKNVSIPENEKPQLLSSSV